MFLFNIPRDMGSWMSKGPSPEAYQTHIITVSKRVPAYLNTVRHLHVQIDQYEGARATTLTPIYSE